MFVANIVTKKILSQCHSVVKQSVLNNTNSATAIATANALRSRKAKSKNVNVQYYVDSLHVKTRGGHGGHGSVSFLSAWCKERAGPDGGDGGNGGHVLFLSTNTVKNLNNCRSLIEAEHGEKGYNKDCDGKNAPHMTVKVPLGTTIRDDKGKVIADLSKEGMIFVAARGGAGGKGNKYFTTATEQAPDIAEYGGEGESRKYELEIKTMAHVGLLGFPNAGKSTLLRAISRARPKVAPYPFTTLHPHIGMVQFDDYEQIAVADLPGLIPDSHKNKGLGIQFLRHAERCCCLLFMIDASTSKPWKQLTTLQHELKQFSPELLTRPQLIVANKMDLPEAMENLPMLKKQFNNIEIIPISAKIGTNIVQLLQKIRSIYDERSSIPVATS